MIGPTIILYGTEEQKAEHLPRITSGEVTGARATASRLRLRISPACKRAPCGTATAT